MTESVQNIEEDKKILASLIRGNNVNSLKTFIESNRNYLTLLNKTYEGLPFLFYIRITKFNPEFLDCLIDYGLNINVKDGRNPKGEVDCMDRRRVICQIS